jgi:poly(3-hydroxybutyrate) depolymerase
MFDRWSGPALPVWYFRPEGTPASAPIVFVMHGVRRNADQYLGEWVETAREHGFVVVVPEFTSKAFPGAQGYNFGGVFTDSGEEQPRSQWSYAAIEPIFDSVRSIEGLTATRYWLFGHSAGAQFVHRYAMLGMGVRMHGAISANAGSYMFATEDERWPFGVAGAPGGKFDFERAFSSAMVLLLGDADNDPAHPSLPHQPQADRQGPHRFARGQNFYRQAREAAARAEVKFQWSCVVAPGVAHENGKMAAFAAAIIDSKAALEPGAECNRFQVTDR